MTCIISNINPINHTIMSKRRIIRLQDMSILREFSYDDATIRHKIITKDGQEIYGMLESIILNHAYITQTKKDIAYQNYKEKKKGEMI
jgi:hypothetical protein